MSICLLLTLTVGCDPIHSESWKLLLLGLLFSQKFPNIEILHDSSFDDPGFNLQICLWWMFLHLVFFHSILQDIVFYALLMFFKSLVIWEPSNACIDYSPNQPATAGSPLTSPTSNSWPGIVEAFTVWSIVFDSCWSACVSWVSWDSFGQLGQLGVSLVWTGLCWNITNIQQLAWHSSSTHWAVGSDVFSTCWSAWVSWSSLGSAWFEIGWVVTLPTSNSWPGVVVVSTVGPVVFSSCWSAWGSCGSA